MNTQRFTKLILGIILSFVVGSANAQIGDWRFYPTTTTPHESKDSTRAHVWGYVFGSAYTKLHADSVNNPKFANVPGSIPASPIKGTTQYSSVPNGFNAISLQRVYVGFDYFFNKKFSSHIVLAHEEFTDGSTAKVNLDNINDRVLYIKYCTVEWDGIFKGSNLAIGQVPLPSFATTEEPIWGYRSLDRTIMDMRGITGSSDLGASLWGKFWRSTDATSGTENACVGYNFTVGNTTGASPDNLGIATATADKRYYGDVYVKFLHDKFIIDLYGDQHTVKDASGTNFQQNIVYRGLVAYKDKNFNITAEYFSENLQNQAIYTDASNNKIIANKMVSGFSIEGAATICRDKNTHDQKLGVIARFDMYNPDNNYSTDKQNPYTENFALFGLDYQPIKQIHLMPNIWYDSFNNRASGTLSSLQKSDNDLVLRLTFYFLFYK